MTKILIVEDERMIAEDIKYTLEQYNYSVTGIFNKGEDAAEKVSEMEPDLILMDIMLEGEINGIEAGRLILKDHNIPIIFLTAYADPATMDSAMSISPHGYVLKPFEAEVLYAAIEIALVKHRSQVKVNESKALFESMFLGNPEPCIYLNNDFQVIDINPRFMEYFGFSLETIKGNNIDLFIIPEDYNTEAAKLNNDTLSGYVYFDTIRKHKDGHLLPVSISAAPILIDNEVKGSFVMYKDITLRKKAEHEREKIIDKLQTALDEVRTLEGMIPICSHCKKVRDDTGFWGNVEQYISKRSNVDFSHGICPECLQEHYPDQYKKMKEKGKI